MTQHTSPLGNEKGFILALVIMLLAVCTVIGLAATMTSTNEIDITTSDTLYRELIYGAEAGGAIAMTALLANPTQTAWTDGQFLDADHRVQVTDGRFLTEGQDSNSSRRWNFWEKYTHSSTCFTLNNRPIDDLHAPLNFTAIDHTPDIQVRVPGMFNIDIDVDKVKTKHLPGSGAEFGTGSEGIFGSKVTYNFDCIGTLPGRERLNTNSPTAEVMVGYRYIPSGM